MIENKCGKCDKDSLDEEPYEESVALLTKYNNSVNLMNPGGREFLVEFEGKKKRIQISDYCYHCDLNAIKKALNLL